MELRLHHNSAGILPVSGFPSKVEAKGYQFDRACSRSFVVSVCGLCSVFVALLFCGIASAQNTNEKVIRGAIFAEGDRPVVGASVGVFDLNGRQIASTTTDEHGEFEIRTNARQGQYELIVTRSQQLDEQQVALGRTNVQIRLVVTSAPYHAPRPAGSTISARQMETPDKARVHVLAAQERFSKMDLTGALEASNAAIHVDATCSEAWSMRSLVKIALKDFQSAVGDATEAIQLDSENASAYVALGTAQNSMKEFSAAEQALRQALEIEPDFWQAQLELAKTWYGERRFVLSLRQLDLITKDFADVHLVRADVLMSLNRRDEGIQEFGRFLRQAPNDPRGPQVEEILARSGRTGVQ